MIAPQLAKEATLTSLTHYIESDDWVMEQKLDGHRVLLCSPGGDFPPTALTRGGSPYTRRLPRALTDFRFPAGKGSDTPHSWVLDGELVGNLYWVFDVVANPHENWPQALPLEHRRMLLENFMNVVDVTGGLGEVSMRMVPRAVTRAEKIALAERAVASNFEGLILKRNGSTYHPGGRTEDWLKVKFVTTADCIVLSVRDDGKESVRLGMLDDPADAQSLKDVGRASLIGKEKNGTINPGDVIEVRYLYTGAGGRLYQPTVLRKRTDKQMHECLTSQLKHVDKTVLETL